MYDIPNIDDFELLPYVEYLAPQLDAKLLNHQSAVNKELLEGPKQLEGQSSVDIKK